MAYLSYILQRGVTGNACGRLHWVTQGSHCNDDYPDKECPQSRGLRVLPPQDWLLYNLDVSPGETRNLSLAAFPAVVAKLTQLKEAHEAEPDIFGPSETQRGSNESLQPCPPQAIGRGCRPGWGGHGTHGHPVPDWPAIGGFTMAHGTLGLGPPYKTHQCDASSNATAAALACEKAAASLCVADEAQCGGFALCDWNAQCSQEPRRGVVGFFTAAQVTHADSDKPYWTLWHKGGKGPPPAPALPLAGKWPLCCQQEWGERVLGTN